MSKWMGDEKKKQQTIFVYVFAYIIQHICYFLFSHYKLLSLIKLSILLYTYWYSQCQFIYMHLSKA